jgi:ABC-type Mn2+/Zn2+ transport system ATPase subunit
VFAAPEQLGCFGLWVLHGLNLVEFWVSKIACLDKAFIKSLTSKNTMSPSWCLLFGSFQKSIDENKLET